MDKDQLHKAARDGYLDLLKDTTRRDCNCSDEDGLTPTMWAAYAGRLEALRLLVGRGGDPDKCDLAGNSSLHWAAANGHFNCVTFLVNFGCNLWSLNNDFQTAKEYAALRNHKTILEFIDNAMASQSALNPKNVQKLKEKAVLDAEKRIKIFEKLQRKASKKAEKEEKLLEKNRRKLLEPINTSSCISSNGSLSKLSSAVMSTAYIGTVKSLTGSFHGLTEQPMKFSDIVNNCKNSSSQMCNRQMSNHTAALKGSVNLTGSSKLVRSLGAVSRKVQLKKQQHGTISSDKQIKSDNADGDRKMQILIKCDSSNAEEDVQKMGKNTVRSLTGLRRDNDVLYVRKSSVYALGTGNGTLASVSSASTVKSTVSSIPSSRTSENSNHTMDDKSLDRNNNPKALPDERDNVDSTVCNLPVKSRPTLKDLFNKTERDTLKSRFKEKLNCTKSSKQSLKQKLLGKKTLSKIIRSSSEPDFLASSKTDSGIDEDEQSSPDHFYSNSQNNFKHNQGSIFERPGFGSVAFRHNLFTQVVNLSDQLNLDHTNQNNQANFIRDLRPNKEVKKDVKQVEQENDSIGNSVESSLSSNSSTVSSTMIETELTDDLDVKITPKVSAKSRSSLKLLASNVVNNLNVLSKEDSIGSAGSLAQRSALVSMMSDCDNHQLVQDKNGDISGSENQSWHDTSTEVAIESVSTMCAVNVSEIKIDEKDTQESAESEKTLKKDEKCKEKEDHSTNIQHVYKLIVKSSENNAEISKQEDCGNNDVNNDSIKQFTSCTGSDDKLKKLSDQESVCQSLVRTNLELFLANHHLEEYMQLFEKERIDFESLMLLTEDDLKTIGLPLGPRKKLIKAIEQRNSTLKGCLCSLHDTCL